jgi:hypothetical protein
MTSSSNQLDHIRKQLLIVMLPTPLRSSCNDGSGARFFSSSCPLPPWQFELSRLYKIVCADSSAALLHYLYHPNPPWHYEADAIKAVWDSVVFHNNLPKRKQKTLSVLCYLAVQNYRSEVIRKKPAHKISRLIEISGVSADNWRRDWRPYWYLFSEEVKSLDVAGLIRISPYLWE